MPDALLIRSLKLPADESWTKEALRPWRPPADDLRGVVSGCRLPKELELTKRQSRSRETTSRRAGTKEALRSYAGHQLEKLTQRGNRVHGALS
ncbi:hypothetical protein AVEN_68418-1 [Araneus ventricosus]|uniref:Uncharacterized protein n=1 Tax=Araneus ventricosus TaxID=182803 RepID=A0A4Y2SMW9_ARAVE|nr:hypothetical protein AVEN_68418-1 [Araneus ventricosus]